MKCQDCSTEMQRDGNTYECPLCGNQVPVLDRWPEPRGALSEKFHNKFKGVEVVRV